MLTSLLKTSLAQHQLLGPNVKYLVKANNKLELTSDPTGALALRMGAILAKGVIKVVDADPNKPMEPTLRTTRVTRVNQMQATELLPERMLNKFDRMTLHLNEGSKLTALVLFGFSLLALAKFDFFIPLLLCTNIYNNSTYAPRILRVLFITVFWAILETVYKMAFIPMASSSMAFSWGSRPGPAIELLRGMSSLPLFLRDADNCWRSYFVKICNTTTTLQHSPPPHTRQTTSHRSNFVPHFLPHHSQPFRPFGTYLNTFNTII